MRPWIPYAIGTGVVVLIGVAVFLLVPRDRAQHTTRLDHVPAPSRPSPQVPVAEPTPVAPPSATVPPTSKDGSKVELAGPTPAAQQFASIRAMNTPDLVNYGEMRRLLVEFRMQFAGAPEAPQALAMLSLIDRQYAEKAEKALTLANEKAERSMSQGNFRGAASAIDSVATGFADGPWLKSAGQLQIAAALEHIEKRRLASLPKPFPEAMANFDQLMLKLDCTAAARLATSEAGKEPRDKVDADTLRTAALVADNLKGRPEAIVKGARLLMGTEVTVQVRNSTVKGVLKEVSDQDLVLVTSYMIGGEKKEQPVHVAWSSLVPESADLFAAKGGSRGNAADFAIASVYASLAAGDAEAAGKTLDAAGTHALHARLKCLVDEAKARAAYNAAMESAHGLIAACKWKEAAAALERALEVMPNDAVAVKLVNEAYGHTEPEPTLTLELAPNVKMDLIYIKPGTFAMGGDGEPRNPSEGVEKPKREVRISRGFYMGKYEVTEAQFKAVTKDQNFFKPPKPRDPNAPIEMVSWAEAAAFCERVSKVTGREARLPAEAEWEYACRAGTSTESNCGADASRLGDFAWVKKNSGGSEPHPVGQKKPNAWGLYDMQGNVEELVADRYDSKTNAPDPAGNRVVSRGGSFLSDAYECRSAYRCFKGISTASTTMGFRIAVTLPRRVYTPRLQF